MLPADGATKHAHTRLYTGMHAPNWHDRVYTCPTGCTTIRMYTADCHPVLWRLSVAPPCVTGVNRTQDNLTSRQFVFSSHPCQMGQNYLIIKTGSKIHQEGENLSGLKNFTHPQAFQWCFYCKYTSWWNDCSRKWLKLPHFKVYGLDASHFTGTIRFLLFCLVRLVVVRLCKIEVSAVGLPDRPSSRGPKVCIVCNFLIPGL